MLQLRQREHWALYCQQLRDEASESKRKAKAM